LREVPDSLSVTAILQTVKITAAAFRRFFACAQPRIAVLGLNPHAGEAGLFGDEEQRLIAPAIAAARAVGIDASGPHSADTLFHFAAQGRYDAVVAMYHDQGLGPLKLLHFEDAVNVTLGLPIVRTSVDHGTAYDLAGTGLASEKSLVAAVNMAANMAGNH
jgi:4-hydroxythreonine-4-phosphate dehydrogenase